MQLEISADHDEKQISKPMKIDDQNMPPLRGLNLFLTGIYKDVAPTALGNRVPMSCVDHAAEAQAVTTDAIIKKVFNAVPVP